MNVAVVDDEKKYLTEMEILCTDYKSKNGLQMELFCFSSGETFLDAMAGITFSIVFMDIYMDGIDGISAARKLRERDTASLLIFLTTSQEFMPEAFSCHAFEYISKPILKERVESVLDDALKILPPPQKFIEVSSGRQTVRIFLHDIMYAITDAHYLEFYLADSPALRCRMTMVEFLVLTGQDPRFILVNRGVLINIEHLRTYEDSCCVMDNGRKLPMRVREAGRIEQAIRDYNFDTIRRQQAAEKRRRRS